MPSNCIVKIVPCPHFDEALGLPFYGSEGAAGADIKACLADRGQLELAPFERVAIPTGLMMEVPQGHELQVRPRSGLSLKTGLMVVNSPGTVDCDYRGEVKILMANLSQKNEVIKHGERIAQLVIAPVVRAQFVTTQQLSETIRGEGGFGSTGRE